MCYFKVLLILTNSINYCSGCLSNTAAAVGPTITTGAMFTTTTTTAATTTTTTVCPNPCGGVPADATVTVAPFTDCTYSTTLSCANPSMMLRFNTATSPVTILGPQMINCVGSNYQFTGIVGTVVIVTVTCV